MDTSYQDLTKVDPTEEDSQLLKNTGYSVNTFIFVEMVISIVTLFAILNTLEIKFEKIVICLLAMIFFHLKSEATFYDLEKHGKDIPMAAGATSMTLKGIPAIITTITLLYIVFLTQ